MNARQPLRVFLSWSGGRSRVVAEGLREWLPLLIDEPQVWMSSTDIRDGARWSIDLANTLEQSDIGILVLTAENITSPWLLFEAGALSKKLLQETLVVPYLVGIDNRMLASGPLAQFQAVAANKAGTRRLVDAILRTSGTDTSSRVVSRRFDAFWQEFEGVLQRAVASPANDSRTEQDALPERRETTALHGQVAELANLIRQLVPSEPAPPSSEPARPLSEADMKHLEGVWVSADNSHMYVRSVNDRLLGPYCYQGDHELTGVYYDWQLFAGQFFVRFAWFSHPVKGFAFYKLTNENALRGMWWLESEVALASVVQMPKTDGVRVSWKRVPNGIFPDWSEDYFAREELR